MTWVLQAAVVLSVLMCLLGAGWAVVLGYRFAKAHRQDAAETAIAIYLSGFRGWLADWVDGSSSEGCASTSASSSNLCEDSSAADPGSSD
ncbi:hypothetical protein ACN47A_27120 [Myxococcus fulvus]|uniref:hypothetical protein n=1 Tax=Myxococcus fulvus TaxID=33 RepID=UPI003B9B3DBD